MNLLNFRQPKASCRLSKDSKIMILFSFVSFLSTLYMYLLFFSLLQVLFISRPHATRILALIIFVADKKFKRKYLEKYATKFHGTKDTGIANEYIIYVKSHELPRIFNGFC